MNSEPPFVEPLSGDFPLLGHHGNLRCKLRNALSDLRWYAYRIFEQQHYAEVTPQNALHKLHDLHLKDPYALPMDLKMIWIWVQNLNSATPQTANQIFYDCWTFIHGGFDPILNF